LIRRQDTPFSPAASAADQYPVCSLPL